MSVNMSRDLLRQNELSKQEKFQVMQKRRAHLTQIGKDAVEAEGYTILGSLKVPGSHGFHAVRDGKPVRIGIKTSADRWMSIAKDKAGGFGLLDKIDELFVVAFDEWPEPKGIQVLKLDPELVKDRAKTVYAEADKLGHLGLQFLPLDEDTRRRPSTTKDASNIAASGTLIFEEEIVWSDGEEEVDASAEIVEEVEEPEDQAEAPAAPEVPIMDRIKKMLSEHMGVPADRIDIEVKIKV